MRKNQITKTIAALMLAATAVCLCACGSETEQSTVESVVLMTQEGARQQNYCY